MKICVEKLEFETVTLNLLGKLVVSIQSIESNNFPLVPMPAVGMRRSTRVFVPKTVAKGGDGVRVLRSGRRLWSEPSEKLGRTTDGEDWLRLIGNSGGGADVRRYKENGWDKVAVQEEVSVNDIDDEAAVPESVSIQPIASKDENSVDKLHGIVYQRKRKRLEVESFESPGSTNRVSEKRRYGIHFSRKQRRRSYTNDEVSDSCNIGAGLRAKLAVFMESFCGSSLRLACFLKSVLRYLMIDSLTLKELSAFMLSEPIVHVFASGGLSFLWDPPCTNSSGICKIFGVRWSVLMFSVNFSALPQSFMYLHSDMLLRSEIRCQILLPYTLGMQTDLETITEENHPINQPFSSENDNSGMRRVFSSSIGSSKLAFRNAHFKNSAISRNIQKKRSSLRSRKVRNPSTIGMHKSIGTSVADLININNEPLGLPSVAYNHGRRRSIRRGSAANIKELKSTLLGLGMEKDITTCSANLLVIESDKCYREEGATVMLEMAVSKQWFVVVKRDGITRYRHKAEKIMRPCTSNRFTQAMIWCGENGWKLEFPNRRDWFIFKELYRECSDHNVETPSVKIIPVPGVQEVSGYGDSNNTPFTRPPDSYINFQGDEVTRAMEKRSANYDMDSEDEEWLKTLNEDNELQECVSAENFELVVDAFEKALYCSPDKYYLDEETADNLCIDLGSREVVQSVYEYWMNKRKQKCSALVRVFQCHQPKRTQLNPKPILRKKRSFKRQTSHFGRGKQRNALQVLAAEQNALEEQNAMIKVEEAKASVNRHVELSIVKRQRAQLLMENADLATYKATMALRIADAAQISESPDAASDFFSQLT